MAMAIHVHAGAGPGGSPGPNGALKLSLQPQGSWVTQRPLGILPCRWPLRALGPSFQPLPMIAAEAKIFQIDEMIPMGVSRGASFDDSRVI